MGARKRLHYPLRSDVSYVTLNYDIFSLELVYLSVKWGFREYDEGLLLGLIKS